MRSLFHALILAAGLLAGIANAVPQCGAPTTTCVDTTPCKTISGATACLSTAATLPSGATRLSRNCWDAQQDYSCDLLQIDTCAPLAAQGCTQSNSVCAQTDANGNCTLYDNTYTCNTLTSAQETTCAGIPTACVLQTSSCMTTSAPGTTLAGQCTAMSRTFECPVPSTTSTTVTDCGSQSYCQGTLCTDAGNTPNTDFGEVAAALEAARQAAAYFDPATSTVFKGFTNSCSIQLWAMGLAGDCCQVEGGAQTNNMIAEQIIGGGIKQGFAAAGITVANPAAAGSIVEAVVTSGASAVGSYASNIYNSASTYVYDVFFPGEFASRQLQDGMISGVQNMVTAHNAANVATQAAAPTIDKSIQAAGTSPASFFDSFSYYGLTISTTAPAAGSLSLGSMGGFNFSFDPWSFAAAVALQVIMDALQCSEQEMKLSQMRGANLCHEINPPYCSNEVSLLFATICLEETHGFCCYNSKLARIINEQGRPQIPRGWGTGQAPECQGFTMAEMDLLDFSTMDLSEFIADITAHLPDPVALQNGIQAKVELMYNNSPPF